MENNKKNGNGADKKEAAKSREPAKEPVKDEQEKTVTIPEAEYAQLKEQALKAQENWDKYVRLQADFDNTRRRWEREKADFGKYANEGLLCDLLNIVDELERSLELSQQKHEDFTAFMKGVEMILAHVHELMKKNGVCCIEAQGKCFDPNYHEALMTVEREDVDEHTVVGELQKGYLLNGRMLRTAKVQVARRKAAPEAGAEG